MIFSAFSGQAISSSMLITSVLAPPCKGPLRAHSPETTTEYKSARVEAVILDENVEAFSSCSALRIKSFSMTSASNLLGLLPLIMYRKLAPWERDLSGGIGSFPFATR